MPTELVFADDMPVSAAEFWPARLAQLREHPGRWVNATATWGSKYAQPVREATRTRRQIAPRERYEVSQRKGVIYVRYLGNVG